MQIHQERTGANCFGLQDLGVSQSKISSNFLWLTCKLYISTHFANKGGLLFLLAALSMSTVSQVKDIQKQYAYQ